MPSSPISLFPSLSGLICLCSDTKMKIARLTLAMFLPLALAFLLSLCACTASRMHVNGKAMKLQRPRVVPNSWCIAKPSSDNEKLLHNVEYSCEQAHVNCSSIQLGGSCFHPNNAASHASFAMNLFYQAAGKHQWDCHFNGTGLVIFVNPSFGNCVYPA